MKLLTGLVFFSLVLGVRGWFSFLGEAAGGALDVMKAYFHMIEANYENSGKYFHARGNYDAAQRGPGGVWVAKLISGVRESVQKLTCDGAESSTDLKAANEWGRRGKPPHHFRPEGLPEKY
ncbi:serum amyloid A-2 protein-like [Microcebus murinus]|uniref:Serum amyloid A protein n=1 Tax=Microcebus murinus TaxID=30608 RepID=A0A8B7HGV5_MICMU|nr:serum amyloid A-2 protein-like [Microcebus murinus]